MVDVKLDPQGKNRNAEGGITAVGCVKGVLYLMIFAVVATVALDALEYISTKDLFGMDVPVKFVPREQFDAMETTLNETKKSLETLTAEKDALQGQVTALTTERDSLQGQVTALTGERDASKTQVATVEGERNQMKIQVDTLTQELATVKQQLAEAQEQATALTNKLNESGQDADAAAPENDAAAAENQARMLSGLRGN